MKKAIVMMTFVGLSLNAVAKERPQMKCDNFQSREIMKSVAVDVYEKVQIRLNNPVTSQHQFHHFFRQLDRKDWRGRFEFYRVAIAKKDSGWRRTCWIAFNSSDCTFNLEESIKSDCVTSFDPHTPAE